MDLATMIQVRGDTIRRNQNGMFYIPGALGQSDWLKVWHRWTTSSPRQDMLCQVKSRFSQFDDGLVQLVRILGLSYPHF